MKSYPKATIFIRLHLLIKAQLIRSSSNLFIRLFPTRINTIFNLLIALISVFLINKNISSQVVSYDFETDHSWVVGGQVSGGDWSRTTNLDQFESGSSNKAMLFTPHNDYGANDAAYITSPAINLSTHTSMTLSIRIRYNTEPSWDGMTIKYSTDNNTFTTLGDISSGSNWFNDSDVDGIENYQDGWSGDNSNWETATCPIPASLENESSVYFRIYFGADGYSNDDGVAFDDFQITGTPNSPSITCGSLSGSFTSCSGSAGSYQTFTCEGSNLTADISVAPPPGYEISTTSDFSSNVAIGASSQSLTLAKSGTTVSTTTIYARLTSSASNGATGNIVCTSSGATTVNVSTGSGTVTTATAPTATDATQCGSGIPTGYVTGTNSQSYPTYNWYTASSGGSPVQTSAFSSLTTYYTNDFSSSLTYSSVTATVGSNASLTGGYVQLTPSVNSMWGYLKVPASGQNGDQYQIQFDIDGGIADGVSYNFCSDGDVVNGYGASGNINPELGTGTGLSISFNEYDNNSSSSIDQPGIYLWYGGVPTGGEPSNTITGNLLAVSTNVSWKSSETTCVITINTSNQLSLTMGGTSIFSNVSLPAGFGSADKSNWEHVFKSRTGGENAEHTIDDLTIQQSYPDGNTYRSSISTTTTFYVSETVNGCESSRTPVTMTVNNGPSTQASSLSFTNVDQKVKTANWTRGNGNNVLVVASTGSYTTNPSHGDSYTANAAYGSGTALGTGYVVYEGSGTSVDITNLSANTQYYISVYEQSSGSCYNTSALQGTQTTTTNQKWTGTTNTDWTNTANWGSAYVPTGTDTPEIPDVTNQPIISTSVSLPGIIIDAGADISVNGNSLTVSGTIDCNGTMIIGDATVNSDGTADFTGGTIDFTNSAGKLILSSAVTSLGTLDDAMGTVEYDGGTQNVISDIYNHLTISTAGTKTASGDITVNKDLTTGSATNCKLDMAANNLTLKGDLNVQATDGLDLSDVSCVFIMGGSTAQSITHAGATSSSTETNTTDYNIPDGNSYVESDINLSSSGLATELVSVTINITHTYTEDLDIRLYSPNDDYIDLSSDNGSSGDNYTNTVFSTSGTAITAGSAPFTGTYQPEQAFSTLSGTANGTWTLRVYDDDGGATGTINDWSLTVYSASGPEFKNLTVNNSAGFSMSSDLEISGTLTLTSGSINTNGNLLHVTASGSVGGSKGTTPCNCIYPDAYTQELTTTSEVEFRTGNSTGTERKSIWVQPENANSVTFSANFLDDNVPNASNCGTGLDHISSTSYYDVTRTAGTENAKVKIGWYTNDQVDDYTSLLLAHYDGSQWQKVVSTPTGSNTAGTIISDGFQSSFSPFALGSSNSGNALPIDLLSFGGECENGRVLLEFVVASQVNNDYFTIERSVDAYKWNEVGVIAGEGNTNTQVTYNWTDDNPFNGVSYYRLAQTDYDGTTKRFDPIAVSCESSVTAYSVYPNPANEVLNIDIELTSYQGNDVEIEIMDINGRKIQSQKVQLDRGYNHLEVDISKIPCGVYMINFAGTKDYIKGSRIIKNNI